jgi:hypothetical protein
MIAEEIRNFPNSSCLTRLFLLFPGMFWILPRFRKIGVRSLDQRVLVAMPKLLREPKISVVMMFIDFDRAFGTIGIVLERIILKRTNHISKTPNQNLVDSRSFRLY